MPVSYSAADSLGVVTILLVCLLILLGILCICYSLYFRRRINAHGFRKLSYFGGPWIVRIIFISSIIWWGVWEVIRLSFVRNKVLDAVNSEWQGTVCKCYVVSNLGFAEPCFFLTLVSLLRAPLQRMDPGVLGQNWNLKTACYVLIFCFPICFLQALVIVFDDRIMNKVVDRIHGFPRYFTRASRATDRDVLFCVHPFLSTIVLAAFAAVVTLYLVWLGRRVLRVVINKNLRKRVYALIVSVTCFLPIRVLFLGLSVLSKPGNFSFEAFSFIAFFALVCCALAGIYVLVYCPVADSLALKNFLDVGFGQNNVDDTVPLIARLNEEESVGMSLEGSAKRGSISFRGMVRAEEVVASGSNEGGSEQRHVELSLFPDDAHGESLPVSPQFRMWSSGQRMLH